MAPYAGDLIALAALPIFAPKLFAEFATRKNRTKNDDEQHCPACDCHDRQQLLLVLVLLIGARSFIRITRVLNELLIIPVVPLVTPPDLSNDEPACDRPPRDDHCP